jgi:hypothetical protein
MRIAKQNRCSVSQQAGHTAQSSCGTSADIVIAHESVPSFGGIGSPLHCESRECEAGTNTRINHTLKNGCAFWGLVRNRRKPVVTILPESTTIKHFPGWRGANGMHVAPKGGYGGVTRRKAWWC